MRRRRSIVEDERIERTHGRRPVHGDPVRKFTFLAIRIKAAEDGSVLFYTAELPLTAGGFERDTIFRKRIVLPGSIVEFPEDDMRWPTNPQAFGIGAERQLSARISVYCDGYAMRVVLGAVARPRSHVVGTPVSARRQSQRQHSTGK